MRNLDPHDSHVTTMSMTTASPVEKECLLSGDAPGKARIPYRMRAYRRDGTGNVTGHRMRFLQLALPAGPRIGQGAWFLHPPVIALAVLALLLAGIAGFITFTASGQKALEIVVSAVQSMWQR